MKKANCPISLTFDGIIKLPEADVHNLNAESPIIFNDGGKIIDFNFEH
jgi:hypothetical protein